MSNNREGHRQIIQGYTAAAKVLACMVAMILALTSTLAQGQYAKEEVAYIAGSGNAALDHQFRQALQDVLGERASVIPLPSRHSERRTGSPVVALGASALSGLQRPGEQFPVLATFVGRQYMQAYSAGHGGYISAIYHDVPLLRQALIGQAILPRASRVALIATPETVSLYEPLLQQLQDYGLEGRIFLITADYSLIPVLVQALEFGDFLLATPDRAIYNPRTIKHILLTAYRHNRIVIGPSRAYVKAGSLASGYFSFPVIVRMAARYLETYFDTGAFPLPACPDEYRVEMNLQVARTLRIPLPSHQKIQDLVGEAMDRERYEE